MDFKQLVDRAKSLVSNRGGTQTVKEDASEVRDIYGGEGTTEDKLKASAEAIKEPGAQGQDMGVGSPGPEEPPSPAGEPPSTPGEPPSTPGEPPSPTGEPPSTPGEPPSPTGQTP